MMVCMTHSILQRALAVAGAATIALSLAACSPSTSTSTGDDASSGYVTDGKLTIGTGEPAYYPWVIDDKPESGEGFEAAIAYAVAEQLGFAKDDVVWVRTTFDEAIAPGPKNFDFNLQQYSITDERKQNVDFSSPYYETTQVVITTETSKAAGAKSIADLKDFLIGAQTGTTSFDAIEQQIGLAAQRLASGGKAQQQGPAGSQTVQRLAQPQGSGLQVAARGRLDKQHRSLARQHVGADGRQHAQDRGLPVLGLVARQRRRQHRQARGGFHLAGRQEYLAQAGQQAHGYRRHHQRHQNSRRHNQ